MDSLSHILVTTDFSDAATPAIEKAVELAARTASALTLLHVTEHDPNFAAQLLPNTAEIAEQAKREAAARLETEGKRHFGVLPNARTALVSDASAVRGIIDYAAGHNVDDASALCAGAQNLGRRQQDFCARH